MVARISGSSRSSPWARAAPAALFAADRVSAIAVAQSCPIGSASDTDRRSRIRWAPHHARMAGRWSYPAEPSRTSTPVKSFRTPPLSISALLRPPTCSNVGYSVQATCTQQVALFRYQLICPALEPGLSTKQRGKVVRGIAGRSHDGPFGGQVRYSRDTLDRWIRRYRAGGFDALSPSIRQAGTRIDGQVFDLAAALKRENPGRTAAQVMRILRASTGWAPSESTLLRHFHRLELMGPAAGQAVVFGRFEADAPNERWVGDALHGPKVGGRKVYLFAFLDDHSRLAVGYRFGFA